MAALAQAHVQQGSSSTGSSIAAAFGSNVAAGHYIVVRARWSQHTTGSPPSITISDSLGNAYTAGPIATITSTGGSDSTTGLWFAKIASAGACTVTASGPNIQRRDIDIFEVSGLAATSPLDGSNNASGTSTAPSSGSITTTAAGFVIGAIQSSYGYGSYTQPGSPWTAASLAAIWDYGTVAYQCTSGAGTYTATASIDSSRAWVGCVLALKDAAGGGGGGHLRKIQRQLRGA
ncbi:MAG: hypothetical protein U1F25_13685 [Rubrivivax sp.]